MMCVVKKRLILMGLLFLFVPAVVCAQGSLEYTGGMKVKLNEDGSKYFRLLNWHQIWIRSIQNNPGTVDVNGDPVDHTFDIGIRRSRFIFYGQINDDFLIMAHWGINNQTFINGGGSGTGGIGGYGDGKKPQLFVHDAITEYKVANSLTEDGGFSLDVGVGLHYWNGLSRTAHQSTLNIMSLDLAVFGYPNIEFSDQFARQIGIYAKGQAGKFGYRLNLNKPFITDNRAGMGVNRAANIPTENWSTAGYIEYQFGDREADLLPYKVGSYLGTKEVFNIGAGYYFHPEASGKGTGGMVRERQDHLHFAVDVFYDKPLNKEKGTALTLYAAALFYDFGDNYFRTTGIMNVNPNGIAGPGSSIAGFGNAEPLLGSGLISYNKIGYLLPKSLLSKGQLQPYAVFTQKQLDYLDVGTQNVDVGMNYYLSGHQAKLSFQYSLRPIITGSPTAGFKSGGFAGAFIMQSQITL
jgi:hypothetical protein